MINASSTESQKIRIQTGFKQSQSQESPSQLIAQRFFRNKTLFPVITDPENSTTSSC